MLTLSSECLWASLLIPGRARQASICVLLQCCRSLDFLITSKNTNAELQGVAVFAVAILAFSRFPPVDSKRIADLTPELDEAATA